LGFEVKDNFAQKIFLDRVAKAVIIRLNSDAALLNMETAKERTHGQGTKTTL
jgi:hypothetical protein